MLLTKSASRRVFKELRHSREGGIYCHIKLSMYKYKIYIAVIALYLSGMSMPINAAKNPVILVTGMAGPGFVYKILAHRLTKDGYNTSIYQLPRLGFGDIHASAAAFAGYVDDVRKRTGAVKVDIVAHSEGGLVSRDYVKNFGGATKVDKVITLGSPIYGTQVANFVTVFTIGTCIGFSACKEMQQGSVYLKSLNAGDHSSDNTAYWAFATKYDELVQPYSNAFLKEVEGNITNITIQDQCWMRIVDHFSLIFDGTVYSGVRQALSGRKDINLDCWAL